MKKKIDLFKNELKQLMKKYDIELRSYDTYSASGPYCATNHYFQFKDQKRTETNRDSLNITELKK